MFYHDNGTKTDPCCIPTKLTKFHQDDQYKSRDVKSPYKWQSGPLSTSVEVINLISDDEDDLPIPQPVKKGSKTTSKDGRFEGGASSKRLKARGQKGNKMPKKKSQPISSSTTEEDFIVKRTFRRRGSGDQNLNRIYLTTESSTSSHSPAKAIGIRIPTHVPYGWVEYAPRAADNADRKASPISQLSVEATSPSPHKRKRTGQSIINRSSAPSTSNINEEIEATPLKASTNGTRSHSTTKALSRLEVPFIENEEEHSALGNRVTSTGSPMLQSWRIPDTGLVPTEHTKALSRIESFTRYLVPASSSSNLVKNDISRSKKVNSKSHINRNMLDSEASVSRDTSSGLYSSDSGRRNDPKSKQSSHNPGTMVEMCRSSSATPKRLPMGHPTKTPTAITETETPRKGFTKGHFSNGGSPWQPLANEPQRLAKASPRDVQHIPKTPSSSEPDLNIASKQEQYVSPSRGGLRPRVIRETETQKKIREWKLKYSNHPFVTRLNSLKGLKNIDIVNELDDDPPPSNFEFISKNIFSCQAIEPDPAAMYGCSCETNCNPKSCSCIGERNDIDNPSGKVWGLPYNFSKHLTQAYLNSRLAVHECNAACACSSSCRNRNITLPYDPNVEIFKTMDRGWGLRSRDPIFKGQFVDTYRGEILTDEEAVARSEQSVDKNIYLFALDKFTSDLPPGEKEYVIDAEFKGSPARFINHSCDPNLRVFCVSLLRGNPRVYELALFAIKDIPPGEELSFDYQSMDGDNDRWNNGLISGSQGERILECLCGAPQCRRHFW